MDLGDEDKGLGAGHDPPTTNKATSAEFIPIAAGVKPLLCDADMGNLPCSSRVIKEVGPSSNPFAAIRALRLKTYQAPDI